MNRLALILLAAGISPAGDVTTYAYDNLQSGHNDAEPVLTRALVSGGRFHKLGTWSLGSSLHCPTSQPLVKTGVSTGSGVKDIVIINTLDGNVYAFDANAPGTAALWTKSYGAYPANLALEDDWYNNSCTRSGSNMANGLSDIGMASTGVITSGNVFINTSLDVSGVLHLVFLNVADGTDFISAVTVSGTSGSLTFDSTQNFQHSSLILDSGSVFFNTSSMGERDPWQGWLFKYNATTGAQQAVWTSTAQSTGRAGMWRSGAGPTMDGSNIWEITGNGNPAINSGCADGVTEYGQAVIRLNYSLVEQDYFSPTCSTVNTGDNDMGTTKLILIPSTNFLVFGAKNSAMRVLTRSSLGGANASPSQSWFNDTNSIPHRVAAGMLYVAASNTLYVNSFGDTIKSYTWGGTSFNTTPASQSTEVFPQSGVAMSYSSNNEAAGSQILWVNACSTTVVTTDGCTRVTAQPGTLYAYDPSNFFPLFSSDTLVSDSLGNNTKYMPPTVVNGKVYVPTLSGTLAVFGIVPSVSGTATLGGKVTVQ